MTLHSTLSKVSVSKLAFKLNELFEIVFKNKPAV